MFDDIQCIYCIEKTQNPVRRSEKLSTMRWIVTRDVPFESECANHCAAETPNNYFKQTWKVFNRQQTIHQNLT